MTIEIRIGDCRELLAAMPDKSVHCCVTSPPYFGLRDYGVDGQMGLEQTPDEYVAGMVDVFRDVRRVLRDDGTLWLNLGDSYANDGKWGGSTGGKHVSALHGDSGIGRRKLSTGLKSKDLIGIPWRVAFALQADGWYLRQDIIWHKPNPMPESVRDRCTKAHEYVFMLSKSPRYYYDNAAVKEPSRGWNGSEFHTGKTADHQLQRMSRKRSNGVSVEQQGKRDGDGNLTANCGVPEKRNRRSVWTVSTKPFKGAHFATFPPDLIEPCILAGCPEYCCSACGAPHIRQTSRGVEAKKVDASELDRFGNGESGVHRKVGGAYQKWLDENPLQTIGFKPSCECACGKVGGTVLDPFGGAGTTGLVAKQHGRSAILLELNPDYAAMARERIDAPVRAAKKRSAPANDNRQRDLFAA